MKKLSVAIYNTIGNLYFVTLITYIVCVIDKNT